MKQNLSQEDLAELLGVSRQAVSKWEQGEGYPEVEKLLVLAEKLAVSLDSLMGLETRQEGAEPKGTGTGAILITSPHENVIVTCDQVGSTGKMKGGNGSPQYGLFGVRQGGGYSSFTPNIFLGWYRDEASLTKEVEEIRQAILRGESAYHLQYSVKTRRHWGRIRIEEE